MRVPVTGSLLLVALLVACGCTQTPKQPEPEPILPERVSVTVPGNGTYTDTEGVRRLAISLPLERQPNGKIIGIGFCDASGRPVDMELAEPLDKVVQDTVAAAFKELGFNVTAAGALNLERPADVKTELERYQSDYLVQVSVRAFRVTTSPTAGSAALGEISLELQVFGSDGRLMTTTPVSVGAGWPGPVGRPTTTDLRGDVEDLLRRIARRITTDQGLRTSLGLTLPS